MIIRSFFLISHVYVFYELNHLSRITVNYASHNVPICHPEFGHDPFIDLLDELNQERKKAEAAVKSKVK